MLATHKLPPPTFTINEIVSAIKRDEFMAFYQPQIDLHSYELSGIELLARWQHPCHGLLAPPQFFPSIVNAGLFNELSHSLIRQALSTQNNLLGQGLDFPLSINLEPSQISDSSFINTMIEQIDQGALSRRPLIIEITEHGSENLQSPCVAKNLAKLEALGWGLSIDDFGTGHSSLTRLCQVSCSELKIDRSFICRMLTDDRYATVVNYIITLARSLGLRVVAEGVETFQQLAYLENIGCRHVQGYLFTAPLSSAHIEEWCVRWSGAALL
ncbi:EAL domain-containing protein [Pseudomonas syringae pv. theae]|uniref:EAL domain-containing protein n=2 Tax=Pseudomonas syringae group TaxID=136849 RepID=A0A261WFG3_9PSED|nr:EAL domain-containing protein [Pseudomonas syringae]OZI84693.1 EAL domain-containing protein [Pseudomonas avellanae]ATV17977.1 EAL domain-containing protein [Pseudomonas syringae pv. actinidiae]KPZ31005.1 hypothetical protein AN901_203189 [Pseudomonas syringae pv. theae]MBL3830101.1 EAL domain-containing protein [Pseudomonas syringae pv. theae]MBL3835734.1 EAL domain-containing protein [Pseudomonas syringae pv. theae]